VTERPNKTMIAVNISSCRNVVKPIETATKVLKSARPFHKFNSDRIMPKIAPVIAIPMFVVKMNAIKTNVVGRNEGIYPFDLSKVKKSMIERTERHTKIARWIG
jgi:hypothetical protein